MKSNKKVFITVIIIFLFILGGIFVVFSNKNKLDIGNASVSTQLKKIYGNKLIIITNDSDHYKINSQDFYGKGITVGDLLLLIVVENYQGQGGIYRYYTYDDKPKLLAEVDSFIKLDNSNQAFNENLFLKDITNDGVPEIFTKVQSGGQVVSYRILRLENGNLESIQLENQQDGKVDFDEVNYMNGYVYMAWHANDARGKTKYSLNTNNLVPVKNVGIFTVSNSEDICEVRVNKLYDEFTVIDKNKCDVVLNKLDEYLQNH